MLLWSLLVIFAAVNEQAGKLTLSAPSSVFEGDSIVLKCQGEPNWKIQRMAYHKDNRELSVFKAVSRFQIQSAVLSDSGDYFCSTKGKMLVSDKRSNIVKIRVQGPDGYRRDVMTARVLGGLFGVLGSIAVALLLYCLFHKISGESYATSEPRGASRPNPQASTHSSPIPDMEELQPVYANANIRTFLENKDCQVIYSSVKK
uniref:Fc receptor like 2 n=1 Tax=Saimiri boliviensis boliviensis TaxID=39432 RepID=A0A2K6URX1_SAIBB